MSGITYQDILDCKKWFKDYEKYKPSELELKWNRAENLEMLYLISKKEFTKTIKESKEKIYVFDRFYYILGKKNFKYLDKLEILNKPIPENIEFEGESK